MQLRNFSEIFYNFVSFPYIGSIQARWDNAPFPFNVCGRHVCGRHDLWKLATAQQFQLQRAGVRWVFLISMRFQRFHNKKQKQASELASACEHAASTRCGKKKQKEG